MNFETSTDASRIFFIDSRDGINENSNPQITTDFTLNLEDPIVVPNHHTILMALHRVNIPRTFYNFKKNRNAGVEIVFSGYNGANTDGFGVGYATLPRLTFEVNEGNYDAISTMNLILTRVNDYLDTGISRFANIVLDVADRGIYEFDMNYNSDALKYEWRIQPKLEADQQLTTRDIRIAFLWKTGPNFGSDLPKENINHDTSIRQEVGFISNSWINTIIQDFFIGFKGATLLADRIWNGGYGNKPVSDASVWGVELRTASDMTTTMIANGIEFFKGYDNGGSVDRTGDLNYFSCVDMNYHTSNLYLHTSITQHSVLDSRIGCRYSNILARIPVSVQSGEEVIVTPSDGSVHKLILKVREITQIRIRLTDLNDKVIDLNGLDWTMSLEFDFIETPEVEVKTSMRETIEGRKYERFLKDKGKLNELRQLKVREGQIKKVNV